MEKRRLGRTGHMSSVAIFGAAALRQATQWEADATLQQVTAGGVNHIDVAPSYGLAEERLAPWLVQERDRFFLGCKTQERTRAGAAAELQRSLDRLQVDAFDLYQLHTITCLEVLDQVTGPGGALEALLDAREEGLTRFIGITSHFQDAPSVLMEALSRFDFDTVLFPLSFVQYAVPAFRRSASELLLHCRERDVGVMIIKAIARGPWEDRPKAYNTRYEPFENASQIRTAVRFSLSHDVTGICTAAEATLLPLILEACERFTPMSAVEQHGLVESAVGREPFFG